jgi:nitroimidazol reductase NimA-like FMN-containing flavoprotein (pyridoxamine 5'-phosphate oxidase superfamily)
MPADQPQPEFILPRRKDRAIQDEAWIESFLQRMPDCVIAMVDEGQPYTHGNLFVYDPEQHAIYFHTANAGRTRASIETNPRVCVSVSEMGRLLPADTAMAFSVEYRSVVVFGCARVVADETESARGLQMLLDKYFPRHRPGRDYRPLQPEELARTAVYRVDIERWSAKQKSAPADFPGAFLYGEEQA